MSFSNLSSPLGIGRTVVKTPVEGKRLPIDLSITASFPANNTSSSTSNNGIRTSNIMIYRYQTAPDNQELCWVVHISGSTGEELKPTNSTHSHRPAYNHTILLVGAVWGLVSYDPNSRPASALHFFFRDITCEIFLEFQKVQQPAEPSPLKNNTNI